MSLALPPVEKTAHASPGPIPDVIALRPATTQDAASVAAIYNASLRTPPYQPDGVSEADGARWVAQELAKVKDKDAVKDAGPDAAGRTVAWRNSLDLLWTAAGDRAPCPIRLPRPWPAVRPARRHRHAAAGAQ